MQNYAQTAWQSGLGCDIIWGACHKIASRCSEGGIAHRSGRWDRRFESCHFDHRQCRSQKSGTDTADFLIYHTMTEFRYDRPHQKTAENKPFWLVFGCFSICFSQNRLFSVDHMFALFFRLLLDCSWLFLNPFENPFSLLTAMQFLRADGSSVSPRSLSSSRQIGICHFVTHQIANGT